MTTELHRGRFFSTEDAPCAALHESSSMPRRRVSRLSQRCPRYPGMADRSTDRVEGEVLPICEFLTCARRACTELTDDCSRCRNAQSWTESCSSAWEPCA